MSTRQDGTRTLTARMSSEGEKPAAITVRGGATELDTMGEESPSSQKAPGRTYDGGGVHHRLERGELEELKESPLLGTGEV